jgi:hypothetical protein
MKLVEFYCSLYGLAPQCLLAGSWLSHSSGTPQVLSSTPRESEFQAVVKKPPSLVPCVKALVVAAHPGLRQQEPGDGGPAYGLRSPGLWTGPGNGPHGVRP